MEGQRETIIISNNCTSTRDWLAVPALITVRLSLSWSYIFIFEFRNEVSMAFRGHQIGLTIY